MRRSRRVQLLPERRARRGATIGQSSSALLVWALLAPSYLPAQAQQRAPTLPNPILFVTQFPISADFATIGSVFAHHRGGLQSAGRGGDLYVLYPGGALRNLTAAAGYGTSGFQGQGAISVRDPSVHWDGGKALFSMVIGAPSQQYQVASYYWQIYEVSGLGAGQPVVITKLAGQPADYNNVSPIYDSQDGIVFVSDRPRNGARHLYPQLDEYESTATPTGIWRLDPATTELVLLDHAPSGDFDPLIDAFGRIVFTRWDHLQQDQQADADALAPQPIYNSFDFADEGAAAAHLARADEVFPEPRSARTDILPVHLEGHSFNTFLPWQMRQDGRQLEILNHLGRHELHSYFNRSRNDDANLDEFIAAISGRPNPNPLENVLHLEEDPQSAGRFVAADAPEFGTHASGQLVALDAAPSENPDLITVEHLTHPATRTTIAEGQAPPANHSGHYRDPLVLSDGAVLAAHTAETHAAANLGTRANPVPRYLFRLRHLATAANGYLAAGQPLTAGITKTVSFYDPDVLVQYAGAFWELDPVEVRARPRPVEEPFALEAPEAQAFAAAAVDPGVLEAWLRARSLALLSVRNSTTRDQADRQQPFNLRVPGGASTIGASGTVYDIAHLQFFQGDQLRGYGAINGRRVLARELHDSAALSLNGPNLGGPPGSVTIAPDGSAASFVPAARALAWQTVAPGGEPIVRERLWLTFQPGEIRACDGCHGVNTRNQAGGARASNQPTALRTLLERWRRPFADDFESGDTSAWSGQQ